MSRQRTIQYAIDKETGLVVSRVDNQYAWPVLDFVGMCPANNWDMQYNLEKFEFIDVYQSMHYLMWTRKIPNLLKNEHRIFWGKKPLKGKNRWE